MTLLNLLIGVIVATVALSSLLALAWLIEQRTGTASWIDCGWTLAVGLVGTGLSLAPVASNASTWRPLVVGLLIIIWSGRLGSHLFRRALRGIDDPRYATLRRQWGVNASGRMFWFAQSQAIAAVPLVAAVLLAAQRPGDGFGWADGFGISVVLAGLLGAGISDWQLRAFAADPANRGRVCDSGLWRYTRHPNYFFEWLGWVGFAILACDVSGVYIVGWLAILAPALMYLLLVHVSGIPLLEEHMLQTRGDAFKDYQKRTSPFFPWLAPRQLKANAR
jgi:steroid 5-alpha reductase family enzyme